MISRPYRSAAAYYHARPAYSAELRPALAARLGWDGNGRLLDVGCGPGVLALELAPSFAEVVALDPEPAMLDEARKQAAADRVRWVEGRGEDISALRLGRFQAITFGQSLHWMDRDAVIAIAYDALEPGGAIVVVNHRPSELTGETPNGLPTIPFDVVEEVLSHYLDRPVKPSSNPESERHEVVIARSPFGHCDTLLLPGRRDLFRTPEWVLNNNLSMSVASPERFGDRLDEFEVELLGRLRPLAPDGLFWEWPGDTEVLIAAKDPRESS